MYVCFVYCTNKDNSPQDLYTMCCNLDFFPSFAQKYLISCLCDCTIVTRPESFLQFSTQIVRNQKLNRMIYFKVSLCTGLFHHSIKSFELTNLGSVHTLLFITFIICSINFHTRIDITHNQYLQFRQLLIILMHGRVIVP